MEKDHVHGIVRQVGKITEEDWETFRKGSSGVYKFFRRIDDIVKHRIVAEGIDSRYCAAGIQKGQQIVIEGGALVPGKSTAPLCMRAIGPLTGFVNTILELMAAGRDPNDRGFMTPERLVPG